jgi:hypothetical protein
VTTPIVLPWPLGSSLEAATRALFDLGDQSSADFLRPAGECALVSPDSVSWRAFKNPLSLFIGGVAAVIMEFAEPRVRTGVWEHTTFRIDPIRPLRRTGLANRVNDLGPCAPSFAALLMSVHAIPHDVQLRFSELSWCATRPATRCGWSKNSERQRLNAFCSGANR